MQPGVPIVVSFNLGGDCAIWTASLLLCASCVTVRRPVLGEACPMQIVRLLQMIDRVSQASRWSRQM